MEAFLYSSVEETYMWAFVMAVISLFDGATPF